MTFDIIYKPEKQYYTTLDKLVAKFPQFYFELNYNYYSYPSQYHIIGIYMKRWHIKPLATISEYTTYQGIKSCSIYSLKLDNTIIDIAKFLDCSLTISED